MPLPAIVWNVDQGSSCRGKPIDLHQIEDEGELLVKIVRNQGEVMLRFSVDTRQEEPHTVTSLTARYPSQFRVEGVEGRITLPSDQDILLCMEIAKDCPLRGVLKDVNYYDEDHITSQKVIGSQVRKMWLERHGISGKLLVNLANFLFDVLDVAETSVEDVSFIEVLAEASRCQEESLQDALQEMQSQEMPALYMEHGVNSGVDVIELPKPNMKIFLAAFANRDVRPLLGKAPFYSQFGYVPDFDASLYSAWTQTLAQTRVEDCFPRLWQFDIEHFKDKTVTALWRSFDFEKPLPEKQIDMLERLARMARQSSKEFRTQNRQGSWKMAHRKQHNAGAPKAFVKDHGEAAISTLMASRSGG